MRAAGKADEIGGYEVPTGASVLLCPFVTHRLPHLWDENPEAFRSERFASDAPAVNHYGYFRSVPASGSVSAATWHAGNAASCRFSAAASVPSSPHPAGYPTVRRTPCGLEPVFT